MDFMSRGGRPAPNAQPSATSSSTSSPTPERRSSNENVHNDSHLPPTLRYGFVALLFSLAILLAAIGIYISTARNATTSSESEATLVDAKKYQAVFLNGGQVYFGKIKALNNKYVAIEDIYYLRVNQQIQPDGTTKTDNQNISLAKLGNELHGPQDRMVINQEQVLFWENLKDDGQVVKAITDFKKNGSQSNTSNSTQGTTNSDSSGSTTTTSPTTGTTTTPSPTPSTNKKP